METQTEYLVGLQNNSDSDDDQESNAEPEITKIKRQRGKSKQYFYEQTYDTLESAKEAIKSEGCWSQYSSKKCVKSSVSKLFIDAIKQKLEETQAFI